LKNIKDNKYIFERKVRIGIGKKPTPSVRFVDSQSVKACNLCEGDIGYDGGKQGDG
jgi:hypothetical protein